MKSIINRLFFSWILKLKKFLAPVLIVAFGIYLSSPIWRYKDFFRGNDLISNISSFVYYSDALHKFGKIPEWNYYLGLGLPTYADPLNSFFSPIIFIFFMVFNFYTATKLLLITSIICAGLSSYYLFRYFKISKTVSVLTSLTYMTSGYLAGRLVAGHLEKIIAYFLIPFFYYVFFSLINTKKIRYGILLGLIQSLFLLSASMYELYYSFLIESIYFLYIFIQVISRNSSYKELLNGFYLILVATIVFISTSFFKLVPMIQYSKDSARNVDPFLGSQTLISIFYSFFYPITNKISELPNALSSIPFRFWEYYAYIGPLPFFAIVYFLCSINRIKLKHKIFIIFTLFFLYMYSMIDSICQVPISLNGLSKSLFI